MELLGPEVLGFSAGGPGLSVFDWREAPQAEFAVIGDPVKHSLGPQMYSRALAELGYPYSYVAIHVPGGSAKETLDFLRARGYWGVNVTVPHKKDAMEWCETLSDFARRVEAANTVDLRTREGANTDAPGFMDTLDGLCERIGRALVLGAGGAARAVVAALCDAGWQVGVFNRTASRAEELVGRLDCGAKALDRPDPGECCLVINATSASLFGEVPDLDWIRVEAGALFYDLSYGEEATPFVALARSKGFVAVDGKLMLAAQGARSLEYWLGKQIPQEAMLRALR